MDGLPWDVEQLVWCYEHQLKYHKVMDELEEAYRTHRQNVDEYVVTRWVEWVHCGNCRSYFPEVWGPEGTEHIDFLWCWYTQRPVSLRRLPIP